MGTEVMGEQRKQLGIEYLRFLLAISVVVYHFFYFGPITGQVGAQFYIWDGFVYGRFAVPAFFIISGYVIYFSAQNKGWRAFAASRVARLYPALAVSALITFIVELIFNSAKLGNLIMKLAAAELFVPLYFNMGLIDPSYWSIVYELRFYAIVAFVVAFSAFRTLPAFLTLAAVVGLILSFIPNYSALSGFLLFPHVSFFALGLLMAVSRQTGLTPTITALILVHLVIAAYGTHVNFEHVDLLDGIRSPIWVSGIICVTCFALVRVATMINLSEGNVGVPTILGGLSYPLYLVHQLAGYRIIEFLTPVLGARTAAFTAILAVLAVSILIFLCVERPIAGPLRAVLADSVTARRRHQDA